MSQAMAKWKRARQRRERAQKRARLEYLEGFDLTRFDVEQVALIESGAIELCPVCQGASAYCWDDCADEPTRDDVAHIPSACGLGGWQCGHCRNYLAPVESMLNAPAYSHCDD